MFDKFVADLLTTYLGEYFDKIDREQVKVSVWNGCVHLRNLQVRKDALRFFEVPVCVLMGTIEELTVVIPWTHLRSESVVVQVRNARIILADKETVQYDLDQEKREERLRKERELNTVDAMLLQAYRESQRAASQPFPAAAAAAVSSPNASSDSSSDSNLTARLKASILNNIRIQVKQFFVHYMSSVACTTLAEDDKDAENTHPKSCRFQSHKGSQQASLSFQIQEMKMCGCNERFEPAFIAPGECMSRQLISFTGLAVSLRNEAFRGTEVPLLHPLNVSFELTYQPVVTDPSTPQYMLSLHLDESCMCTVTSESCTTCHELLRNLRHVHARLALRRLRPVGERPTQEPRRWWRYVLDAVQQQVRHDRSASAHKPTPFSWLTYSKTKAKRDRYVALYLRRQRAALGATGWLEPLSADEHVEMVLLEEELSTEMLKLAKRLAVERAMVERVEFEKLLRQKATAAATNTAAASSLTKTATAAVTTNEPAPTSGGWFSFWRSTPQQTGVGNGSGVNTTGAAGDSLDDETRAELRELVQLMTAEKWTDSQRAVIAREFGISEDEAKELAQIKSSKSSSSATVSDSKNPTAGSSPNLNQWLRAAPRWIVFIHAVSVSLELRSCNAEAQAPHESLSKVTTQDTVAKLLLEMLKCGAEWGSNNSSGGAGDGVTSSPESVLPLAYYWGSVQLLSITAANLNHTSSSNNGALQQEQQKPLQQREQEILTIRQAHAGSGARQSTSPFVTRRATGDATSRHPRPFPPLEACWPILSDECRRTAALQCEWTQRSLQQLTPCTSAVHRARIRLAPLSLVVDVVPLRHLTDFFLAIWPSALAQSGDTLDFCSPKVAQSGDGDFLTALRMPAPRPSTYIEQRCATDPEARRIILRSKVERQHSIEWDVLMDCVTVLVSEIPEVQGCELVVKKLTLRNDIAHRLLRQERLQSDANAEGNKTVAAVLGSSETDWFDYTHVEAGSMSLSVFLPTSTATASSTTTPLTSSPLKTRAVIRQPILAETPLAVVVEKSLLGRCLPEKPPYKLRFSSASIVQLSWSRSTLSVFATSCSKLADLATSVSEAAHQRGDAYSSPAETEMSATSTFHVGVVPHPTHKALWRETDNSKETQRRTTASKSVSADKSDLFYKQMDRFIATRRVTTTGISAATTTATLASGPKRRVDIRRGVCVLYHPERLSFPAEYYTLRKGCIRVRCAEEKAEDGNAETVFCVHLYITQGGADQEEVLTAESDAAERLLVDKVGVPPALLHNAVWLESAVRAWMADKVKTRAPNSSSCVTTDADRPSVEAVQSALELVLWRTHLVPCQYVAFQCASMEEAHRLESTLLRCCVEPHISPLELTPAVQAVYNASVAASQLRKQPLWSVQVGFPSLQMTCEGKEPVTYCDVLSPNAALQTARRDTVLAFTPFDLCYDRFAEKRRFELTVAQKTEIYACTSSSAPNTTETDKAHDMQTRQALLQIAPRTAASSSSPSTAASLFLRVVTYNRPLPLPSLKRCGIYVDAASTLKVRVGPAMFEWAEAWWDSFGLLTNRLFAEKVIIGYPWWSLLSSSSSSSLPSTIDPFLKARDTEAAWHSTDEYGSQSMSTMVDLIMPSMEVEVAVPQSTMVTEDSRHRITEEWPVVRFAARGVNLQWRLTEALNHVNLKVRSPVLQWRPLAASTVEPSAKWTTVVDSTTDSTSTPNDGPALMVDWLLHKSPPMLSTSDWLCHSASVKSNAEGAALPQLSFGFRDSQEMNVELSGVTLLYWHPLLIHLIQLIQDGVLRRGVTLVSREPCWFDDGVFYCPPLTWPLRGLPTVTEISWDRLRKSVALHRVVLQIPGDVRWMENAGSGVSLTCACEISIDSFTYADHLRGRSASPAVPATGDDSATAASPDTRHRFYWDLVEQVHVTDLCGMSLRRCTSSTTLSPTFNVVLPNWSFKLTLPVFQSSSLWKEKETWRKAFNVCLHGSSNSKQQEKTDTTGTWKGTSGDLAFVINLMHANYVAGSQAANVAADLPTCSSQQLQQQHPMNKEDNFIDTSPATLLKPVVETSTWFLDVDSLFKASISSSEFSTSMCNVELGGAQVVVERTGAGELSCCLEAHQLLVESGAGHSGSEGTRETNDVVQLLRFPGSSPSCFATSPLLRIQYSWRLLTENVEMNTVPAIGSTAARALYALLESTDCLCVTADSGALAHLQFILQSPSLRDSLSRHAATQRTVATPNGWENIEVKAQLAQLALQLPCEPTSGTSHTAASQRDLQLCVLSSGVVVRLRRDASTWRGMLQVGRLAHCVLRNGREGTAAAAPAANAESVVPLVLEQPAGWSPPTASLPRVSRRTHPSPLPTHHTLQHMEAPRLAQTHMLDELFDELPSPISTATPAATTQTNAPIDAFALTNSKQTKEHIFSQSSWNAANADKCLVVEFTHAPAKSTFITALKPLWLFTPSMPHVSLLLTGIRQKLHSIDAVIRSTGTLSAPPSPGSRSPAAQWQGAFSVDIQVGAVSMFVLQKEVAIAGPQNGCTARQIEEAVQSAPNCEGLLVATGAVLVQWDSVFGAKRDGRSTAASPSSSPPSASSQTVLQLRDTSIFALRGLHQCTVLLEHFGACVTRQLKGSGSTVSRAEEEWNISLDPLQLTLTKFHYAELLRLAFQQTSFLAMRTHSASTASQPLAAAATTTNSRIDETDLPLPFNLSKNPHATFLCQSEAAIQTSIGATRSFRVQLASLNLRVEEDGEGKEAAAQARTLAAVYIQLEQFNAAYYSSAASTQVAEAARTITTTSTNCSRVGDASNESLRFAVSLQNCLVGTEGAIPTFSLAPPTSSTSSTPACVLRILEDNATKAKIGKAQVKQATITAEVIPVMTFLDLLYAPYQRIAVPDYQTAKELVMQRDMWLTDDLVLTERAPLRVVNKSYNLLYLYGNGRTIYLNAERRGQLILLDEGMTLRIMHAIICMKSESIEAYVSAGNGSYVVVDRETCTVARPSDSAAAAAAQQATENLFFSAEQPRSQPTAATPLGPKWTQFDGDVQVQLRVPEPHPTFSVSSAAFPLTAGLASAQTTNCSAQRTLVLYSNVRVALVNAASAVPHVSEVSGSFVLAHAGVRSEFVTAQGVTANTSDLISDWAMMVQYTEEKNFANGTEDEGNPDASAPAHSNKRKTRPSAASRRRVQNLRSIFIDASNGVDIRVQYSDVFLVLRAARHAQAAFAKWKDAMWRDLWSSLTALPHRWNVERVESDLVKESLIREGSAAIIGNRCSETTGSFITTGSTCPEDSVETRTSLNMQIPYVSFLAVDDSQNTDTPLFCLCVKEIRTPDFVIESPQVKAELRFTIELDYYELAQLQWAPVLDRLSVTVALNWRLNTSILDVYNRQGYVRLTTQTGSMRCYFTLGLLRNLRQLQLLSANFEAAKVEKFFRDAVSTADGGTGSLPSSTSSLHAYNLLQTTGVSLAARLPECVPSVANIYKNDSGSNTDAKHSQLSSSSACVLASGESWAFNLPCARGEKLLREQQKILVQHQHQVTPTSSAASTNQSSGAVLSVASVGVQRVCLSTCGPLKRYVVADISVPLQKQGQKQIHLHSTILFQNRLSVDVVQLAANPQGTYDVVGTVPAGKAQYVSVEVLRRRVYLVLCESATLKNNGNTSTQQQQRSYALSPDAVVALGVSYDALPCLVGNTFLCVSASIAAAAESKSGTTKARGPGPAASQTRLAKGKYFDIYNGNVGKSYFLLRVQATAEQPGDVRRFPALAPLRSITVEAEAAVTIHNAVGLPLTVTLLTRRVVPGVRLGLLDIAPDTAIYTVVHTTTLEANESYGATEMDPFDDVCISVALQQPNGCALLQWSSQLSGNGGNTDSGATAYYPPACVYCSSNNNGSGQGRRDEQIVLTDTATGATLVLCIKYTKLLVTLYCPQWIVNETELPLQLADTSSPRVGTTDRCANPIAGLGGCTVRSATVAAWNYVPQPQLQQQTNLPYAPARNFDKSSAHTHVYLYNSLRAESCSKKKSNAGTNGLFVRVWEAATGDSSEPACFSDWSQQALSVHETAGVQVVTCASRRVRDRVFVLSCRVELGSRTNLHAYSDTRVVYIRPRWVLMNKSPYTLCFSQSLSSRAVSPLARVKPFSATTIPFVMNTAGTASQSGQLSPLVSFTISDDVQHNIQQCRRSFFVPINAEHEEYTNLVYKSLIPLTEYWPQSSAEASGNGKAVAQRIPDSLPPLQPENIKEINGELFVDREEAKVFSTIAYTYKDCMMCVEFEEAAQPPIVVENRTSYMVCFQQRGVRQVSNVFPRRRKVWTWDAPPSNPSTPAIIELWLARERDASSGGAENAATKTRGSSPSVGMSTCRTCVLNFDPQQVIQQSRRNGGGFQQQIEVIDPVHGTPSMLFVRVRGVRTMSYVVSITTEPTIDVYRTLPYPQLSFALQVESVYALLCGEDAQGVLLCGIRPLSFAFAQGVRRRGDGADNAEIAVTGDAESADTDIQQMRLRFYTFQVDDERSAAKERVVAQLIDDRESGFQIERKLLRTTPILYCSVVAFRLTPIELHVEDSFITSMMNYKEVVHNTWELAWPAPNALTATQPTTGITGGGSSATCPPWKSNLVNALALARRVYGEVEGSTQNSLPGTRTHCASPAPLWSRFIAIDQLSIDPVFLSLSLYRSPGVANDPLWKIADAASLFIGSTQDARLQWDAVQCRRVFDTIWHLFSVHRDAYRDQMKRQYMSLVNVMGLDTMRNFVSDLLNAYSDDPHGDGRGGNRGCAAVRRQKPRLPLRRYANLCLDEPLASRARAPHNSAAAAAGAATSSPDSVPEAESFTATTAWLEQVPRRSVPVKAQLTVTVAEVARSYPWNAFLSVAQSAEIRAFGGLALTRCIAEMAATPRYRQIGGDGGTHRQSAQEAVSTNTGANRVQCTRCIELEALRLQRMHEGAATPLPHPIKDGFLTWEEFAHHINWYEFVDMCSDDEVCKYASLVRAGVCEASSNVCIIAWN